MVKIKKRNIKPERVIGGYRNVEVRVAPRTYKGKKVDIETYTAEFSNGRRGRLVKQIEPIYQGERFDECFQVDIRNGNDIVSLITQIDSKKSYNFNEWMDFEPVEFQEFLDEGFQCMEIVNRWHIFWRANMEEAVAMGVDLNDTMQYKHFNSEKNAKA